MKNKKRTLIWIACIVLAAAMLLTACQPTPEREIVAGKGDDTLDQIINSNTNLPIPTVNETETPMPEWQDHFTSKDGTCDITINAAISIPQVQAYPILKVQPAAFTNDQLKNTTEVLLKGMKVYDGTGMMTKSSIMKSIVRAKAVLAQSKESPPPGVVVSDNYIKNLEKNIADLEELYKTAPDELPQNPPVYKLVKKGDFNEFHVFAETSDETMYTIDALASDDNKTCKLEFLTDRHYVTTTIPASDGTSINESFTFSEAVSVAENVLHELGIDYMQFSNADFGYELPAGSEDESYVTVYKSGESEDESKSSDTEKLEQSEQKCFVINFTRSVNGIPGTFVNGHTGTSAYGVDGDNSYRPPWDSEYVQIIVDEKGIASLTWQSPTDVVSQESGNVTLMSLDEIKDVIKQQLQIKYNAIGHNSVQMTINKISLGMTRVAIKNDQQNYRYIPCWDCFGYYTYNDNIKQPDGRTKNEQGTTQTNLFSLLTINAVTGEVIDRGREY